MFDVVFVVGEDALGVGPATPVGEPVSSLSFADFYRLALPQIYGFLLARCSDPGTAEELCADAFLVAASQLRNGTEAVNLPWLFGVARHKLLDFYRRRGRLRRLLLTIPPDPVQLVDTRAGSDREVALLTAMRSLPDGQRAALLLRYQDDLPVAEVAAALEVSVQAASSLLARARHTLRSRLEGVDLDD